MKPRSALFRDACHDLPQPNAPRRHDPQAPPIAPTSVAVDRALQMVDRIGQLVGERRGLTSGESGAGHTPKVANQ